MKHIRPSSSHSCYCYNNVIYLLTNTFIHYWGNAAEMQQLRKQDQRFNLSFSHGALWPDQVTMRFRLPAIL